MTKRRSEQLIETLLVNEDFDADLVDAAKCVGDAVSYLQTTSDPKAYSSEITQLKSIEKSLDAKISKAK